MGSAQLNTLYEVEPEVLLQTTNFVQQQVRYESLSEMLLPVDESLETLTKRHEYWKEHDDVGMAFEMDPVSPPDSTFAVERKFIDTPLVYSNVSMDFDTFQRVNRSVFSLQDRLAIHASIMARRQDIINYLGDSKHGITAFGSVGTELDTALSTATLAASKISIEAAIDQLQASMKYGSRAGKNAIVILQVSPLVWKTARGVITANFGSETPMDAWNNALKDTFSEASRVVKNHYLGASATIDENGRLTGLTVDATGVASMYIQDPTITKILASGVETRVSPIDQTKGVTFQPIKRYTRLDTETLGMLKEGGVALS